MKRTRRKGIGVLLAAAFLLSVCQGGCAKRGDVMFVPDMQQTTESAESDTRAQSQISVYVCGAVRHPGVYTLPAGSRVCDAVEAAGGMKKNASADAWNLAEYLTDARMIRIPTVGEVKEAASEAAEAETGSLALKQDAADDGRVNLNAATKEELMTLPGVGESRAAQIIAYRQENGPFAEPEDVMKVSGIGEGIFAQMKDYICLK